MRKTKPLEGVSKTLEGGEPLLKAGFPSLQTSLSSRELPPRPRHLKSKNLICFLSGGVVGEVFRFGWEVELRHYRVIPMVELRSNALKCG